MLVAGCWMLDAATLRRGGCWMLVAGCWRLDWGQITKPEVQRRPGCCRQGLVSLMLPAVAIGELWRTGDAGDCQLKTAN